MLAAAAAVEETGRPPAVHCWGCWAAQAAQPAQPLTSLTPQASQSRHRSMLGCTTYLWSGGLLAAAFAQAWELSPLDAQHGKQAL